MLTWIGIGLYLHLGQECSLQTLENISHSCWRVRNNCIFPSRLIVLIVIPVLFRGMVLRKTLEMTRMMFGFFVSSGETENPVCYGRDRESSLLC